MWDREDMADEAGEDRVEVVRGREIEGDKWVSEEFDDKSGWTEEEEDKEEGGRWFLSYYKKLKENKRNRWELTDGISKKRMSFGIVYIHTWNESSSSKSLYPQNWRF